MIASKMNKSVIAGIDIGGTKIAVALENSKGERVATRRLPTDVQIGPENILENVSKSIKEMLAETRTDLTAIGIGCPGPIDIERGLALSPTNLQGWIDFPIVEVFREKFSVSVAFDNDANVAALGEFSSGAGRGFGNILYVTISTGIGGAIIIGGKIHHGIGASAGEVGHSIVKPDGLLCRCGNYGCLETIASGLSIARRMQEVLAINNGQNSERYAEITAQTVVESVRNGDETARKVWDETLKFLGIGIGNAVTIIAPEAVVIGGGISTAGEILFAPLRREISKNVSMMPFEKVAVLQASLGGESGLCGALMLARNFSEIFE